jgi:MarR family transcriptional regulator, lower aerobic nicotinate degradation pathway regulator
MTPDPAPRSSGATPPGDVAPSADLPHRPWVGLLLLLAHRRATRTFAEALSPLGIEAKHYGVLSVLGRQGPVSQRQLIDHTHADKSSMVRTVDDLESLGLAVRRTHPADRRAHAVGLTDRGREVLERADHLAEQTAAHLLSCLPPSDSETLCGLLATFVAAGVDAGAATGSA